MVSGYTGTNDHKGLAGPTNRTGEVAKNLKIFWGKVGEFIWGPRL